VRRVNYAPAAATRELGARAFAALPSLRVPLVALGVALLCAATLWAVEDGRLRRIAAARDANAAQLTALEPAAARARATARDVTQLRAAEARLDDVARSGARQANEVAALGNALPPDVWLASLRWDHDALAVEGHAARVSAVAATLRRLALLRSYAAVRLTSARTERPRAGVAYALALDRRP